MSFIKEFKLFATKGNMVDMAVGIIIGAAFGKIVTSLVADVIMPPIGLLVGGLNFTDITFILKGAVGDKPAVTLNIGNFIQVIFDFIIVAFAIFLMIKAMNRLRRKEETKPVPAPEPSTQEKILGEIRDILKEK